VEEPGNRGSGRKEHDASGSAEDVGGVTEGVQAGRVHEVGAAEINGDDAASGKEWPEDVVQGGPRGQVQFSAELNRPVMRVDAGSAFPVFLE
jgi:hypothetical protein